MTKLIKSRDQKMIQFVCDSKAFNFLKTASQQLLAILQVDLCLQKFIMSAFAAQLNSISNCYFL